MSETIEVHFPFAGIDVSGPVSRQPNRPAAFGQYARTCAVGVNVRGIDYRNRARGGMRPGIVKYLAARPGSVQFISQELACLVATGIAAPGGTTVQSSQSGRLVLLVAVSKGNVYTVPSGEGTWTIATNETGNTPPLNYTGTMQSASNNQLLFFADGINRCYFDPATNAVRTWTATAGTFPADSANNTARLICTWRGRTVLAGFLKDPGLICMSKVSDPFNFDYAPPLPVPADAAWAGSVGPQGKIPDVVTALIPYTDDVLIVGTDSTIAVMRGDPNYGGSVDTVTTSIGIAWGRAWAMDSKGIVYFFSNRTGIFAFVPGNQPQRISTPIDPLLLDINTGDYSVLLQWNERFEQLHVWVTLLSAPAPTTHYVWESRANAWWQDVFANALHNPICCVNFDGNNSDDRQSLIGGWDGYVRSISSSATTDDGTEIDSEVWIGPVITKFNDAVMIKEVQGVLAADSDNVDYAIYVADTAEEALESEPVSAGTWAQGRNFTDNVRRTGYADYLQLTSTGQWAMENIRMVVQTMGQVRQRGKA